MVQPTDFAYHLTQFLSVYLPNYVGASKNTILSYRDSFSLFLRFSRDHKKIAVEKLSLDMIDAPFINDFLDWLESERKNSVSTRNQRLAALHAFFRFLQYEQPQNLASYQKILAIPMKRGVAASMNYLSLECVQSLLTQPDTTKLSGRRDVVLLSLLYDTGARVQELVDLKVSDIRVTDPMVVKLTGKGRKSRLVPVMTATSRLVKQYLEEYGLCHAAYGEYPLFCNRSGKKLTRAGVAYILNKYVNQAKAQGTLGFPDKLSPHCLRHSKAMHLLQSGINLIYIRDLLGHVDVKTTEVYARADEKMKRAALEAAYESPSPEKIPSWKNDPELLDWLKSLD